MSVKKVEQQKNDDLQQLVNSKHKELQEERSDANPDGKLSFNQLLQIFIFIEGYDPRQQKQPNSRGLIDRPFGDQDDLKAKFKTKCKRGSRMVYDP